MARRSRREDIPNPEDYLPDEDEFEDEEEPAPRRKRRARVEEDDDEETPRRKRRPSRDADDDEDETPRRKRRTPRDDDEEDDEEEAPRRKRRPRDEDDEDEAPRRKRRPRDDDEDDEDDEDEDDKPRRRGSKKKSSGRSSNRNSGWGGYQKVKSQSSNYADKLVVSKLPHETLVKFIDDEPFDSFGLHWFDEMPSAKKGWTCLESVGEERCPGCDLGDRPNPNALFNVLVFDDDGDPNLQVLAAGSRMAGQLSELAGGKGGLTGTYWSVTAGPKGSGTGNWQRVKERDLEEDWDIEPLSDEEIEEFEQERHVLADVENIPSYKDFKEAVRSIED